MAKRFLKFKELPTYEEWIKSAGKGLLGDSADRKTYDDWLDWRQFWREKATRFNGHAKDRKPPGNVSDFVFHSSMERIEYAAAAKAAEEAIRFEREYWLPVLERWRDELKPEQFIEEPGKLGYNFYRVSLDQEIRRLKRCLDIRQNQEEKRVKTCERVRRHRKRKRNDFTSR
jgi:hypothetical protein